MLNFQPWKTWTVIVICLLGVLFAAPNLASRQTIEQLPGANAAPNAAPLSVPFSCWFDTTNSAGTTFQPIQAYWRPRSFSLACWAVAVTAVGIARRPVRGR